MNSHSQHAWTQSPWGPRASRSRTPVPTASRRSHFKERITLKTMSFHGDDCSLQLGFIAHARRLCLAEWMSAKRANASCACVLVKPSSSAVWARNRGLCCPPNLMPYVENDCHWDWASERKWKHDTTDLIQKNSYCHRPEMLNICRIGEKYIC